MRQEYVETDDGKSEKWICPSNDNKLCWCQVVR